MSQRLWRRGIRLLVPIALLLTVVVLTLGAPASGQATDDEGPDAPTLRIADQNTFVAADGSLDVIVEITGLSELGNKQASTDGQTNTDGNDGQTITDVVISPVIYGRLSEESEVDGPTGTAITRLGAWSLSDLESVGQNRWRVSVPIRSSDRFDGQERALLREPGVYPVTLEIRDLEGPLASVRTHLVRLPVETSDAEAEPSVPVSVILAISTAEGLSVDSVVALLTEHPTMPLTVLLGPGVLNQLEDDERAAARLAEALVGRPVLAAPTIDLDPSALAEIDQADLFVGAARSDRDRLSALGLVPATGTGLLEAPLTADGVAVVQRLGWQSVLDVGEQRSTSTRLRLDIGRFTVIRPDAELTALLDRSPLTRPDDGSFRANRVLARLALRGLSGDEAVVLGGPALGLDAKDALAAVLRALTQPGGPRPVPLTEVEGGPTERPPERPAQDLRGVADQVADLRDRIATFGGFATSSSLELAMVARHPSDRRLLAALTRQRNPGDRARALALLNNQLDEGLAAIELHDPQPVTLAARSAPLPVVLDNNAADGRTVLLRFRSDGLVSPDDGRVVNVAPGTSSINVDIEARSLGVSPLEISVWTPDGSTQLDAAQFEVRSTAVPGVGVAVSLVAGVVLALWWWVDRNRRAEKQVILDPEGRDRS